jgi:hypothetical protein
MAGVIGGSWFIQICLPGVDERLQAFLAREKSFILFAEPFDYLEEALHALVAVILLAVRHLLFKLGCISQLLFAESLL